MKTNFDYNSVPDNFTHCLNKQCSHAADCLRHQVALHIPSERDTINIVNPVYAAANGGENCSFFKVDQLYATHQVSCIYWIKFRIAMQLSSNSRCLNTSDEMLITASDAKNSLSLLPNKNTSGSYSAKKG